MTRARVLTAKISIGGVTCRKRKMHSRLADVMDSAHYLENSRARSLPLVVRKLLPQLPSLVYRIDLPDERVSRRGRILHDVALVQCIGIEDESLALPPEHWLHRVARRDPILRKARLVQVVVRVEEGAMGAHGDSRLMRAGRHIRQEKEDLEPSAAAVVMPQARGVCSKARDRK